MTTTVLGGSGISHEKGLGLGVATPHNCNVPKDGLGTLCKLTRESMSGFNETCNKHCKTQPKLPQTW